MILFACPENEINDEINGNPDSLHASPLFSPQSSSSDWKSCSPLVRALFAYGVMVQGELICSSSSFFLGACDELVLSFSLSIGHIFINKVHVT